MTHRRQSIREAFAATLVSLPHNAVVTIGRVYPFTVPDLPTVNVHTPSESLDMLQAGGPPYPEHRTLVLQADIRADGDTYLTILDDIAEAVEAAVMVDPTLSGLCDDTRLESMALELLDDVESPGGEMVLNYEVRYSVDTTNPT